MNANITTQNRLSDLFAEFPDAVESIVALDEHDFARLRNPLMRRLMSPRITLNRIAAMVGMSAHEFAAFLCGHGYMVEAVPVELPAKRSVCPAWWHKPDYWVDVLKEDDAGADPLPPIMLGLRQLEGGLVMGIKHRWEPQPLFDVWNKMGVRFWTERVAADEWHIYISL